MTVPFYRAFEDRHRGSRELIHERLKVYAPFLEPIKKVYGELPAVDLGCGRGEWLELLAQWGFTPVGVDLDEGMLEACLALGLPAQQGDALSMLKSLEDDSQVLVSGFHIAEHITFADLKELVFEALRVLKPGGLLVLETPNAENITVGTQNFYLDPTHERPIPHLLLSFLTEYSGFSRSKLLRLQESPVLAQAAEVDLMSVLGGVSPDYAIVAQKDASPVQLQYFDAAFNQDFGLSLDALAQRYDVQTKQRKELFEARTSELGESVALMKQHMEVNEQHRQQLEISMQQLIGRSLSSETRLSGLEADSNHLRQQMQDIAVRTQIAETRFQQGELVEREVMSRMCEAQARLSAVHAVNEMLQAQLQAEKSQVSLLQTQAESLKHELRESRANTDTLETELNELELEYQKVELERLAPQHEELTRLLRQLADAQDREELLESQLDSNKEDAVKTEAHTRLLESAHFKACEQVSQLQEDLGGIRRELKTTQDERLAEREYAETLRQELIHKSAAENAELNAQLVEMRALTEDLNSRLNESLGNAHHWWLQAGLHQTQGALLVKSNSWRITWPLRLIKRSIVWLLRMPGRLLKKLVCTVLVTVMKALLKRPSIGQPVLNIVRWCPPVYGRLQRFARNREILPSLDEKLLVESVAPVHVTDPIPDPIPVQTPLIETLVPAVSAEPSVVNENVYEEQDDLSGMTLGARRIYLEMKQATRHKGTC